MIKNKGRIIWVDDEIDHLQSHILFLEEKGYEVTPVTNAEDAITLVKEQGCDLLLLDEMLTGMDGLQSLPIFQELAPWLPIIMITKSEQEDLMEEAIAGNIKDYLTKPVNPSQILSSCKRILETQRISEEKITRDYTQEFSDIMARLDSPLDYNDWINIHIKLSEREIDLDSHQGLGLNQTLYDQRKECNQSFGRYIQDSYMDWINGNPRPLLSVDIVERFLCPVINDHPKVLFIVIDNLRLDQWMIIEPFIYSLFSVQRNHYYSILPTATPYSRNALFAGLFPKDIEKHYPDIWAKGEDDETSRNRFEADLLRLQLERLNYSSYKETKYIKILDVDSAKQITKNTDSYLHAPLTALVFNFVDLLAHKRSESQILKEIVPDEAAYRSLTRTWFEHSSLFQILKNAANAKIPVILTSDHGSIRVMNGTTVYADRETSTNLRYKCGKNIRGESKHLIEMKDPAQYGLPRRGMNTNFLIAKDYYFFVYPTNYHYYLNLYKDTFQHGGVSMEEMILPIITMMPLEK